MKNIEKRAAGRAGSQGSQAEKEATELNPVSSPDVVPDPVRDKFQKAKSELKRFAAELGEVLDKRFSLLLQITFVYIVLKVAKNEAYVAEVFAPFREIYKDKWYPDVSTLQHYEGPMRKWLRHMAALKDSQDPNLKCSFTTAFLTKNPHYFLTIQESDLDNLGKKCGSLVNFDREYGNGRVKPIRQQTGAAQARTQKAAEQTGQKPPPVARPSRKEHLSPVKGSQAKPCQGDRLRAISWSPGSTLNGEGLPETLKTEEQALLGELRTRVHQLDGVLALMISKKIRTPPEVVNDIRTCYGKSLQVASAMKVVPERAHFTQPTGPSLPCQRPPIEEAA